MTYFFSHWASRQEIIDRYANRIREELVKGIRDQVCTDRDEATSS